MLGGGAVARAAVGVVLVVGLAVWPDGTVAQATCTKQWVGGSQGDWKSGSAWAPAGVPTASDRACISADADVRVDVSAAVGSVQSSGTLRVTAGALTVASTTDQTQIQSLVLAGGNLDGAASVEVTDSFAWSGGSLVGSGRLELGPDSEGTISGAWLSHIQRTLVNAGTLTLATGASVWGYSGARIENGGELRVNSEDENALRRGDSAALLNSGVLRKAAGSGRTRIGYALVNEGSVEALSGELSLEGGGSAAGIDGAWRGDGGVVRFSSGSFAGGRWTVTGRLDVAGATIAAEGIDGDAAEVRVVDGVLNLSDAAASEVQRLTLAGGQLTGSAAVEVTGTLSWASGALLGSGALVLGPAAEGTIVGSTLYHDRRLVNRGLLTLVAGASVWGYGAARIENEGELRFNSEDENALRRQSGGTLVNTGVVRKTSGPGRSRVGYSFANAGVVEGLSGELVFVGGGGAPNVDGSWRGDGGVVRLSVGSYAGGRWEIDGRVEIAGAEVTVGGLAGDAADLRITDGFLAAGTAGHVERIGSLTLSGGSLRGSGTVLIADAFVWTGGGMYGAGQTVIAPSATGTISGASVRELGQRTVVNRGEVLWSGGQIWGSDGARIDNRGTIEVHDGTELRNWMGARSLLSNRALLVKSGGAGTSIIGFDLASSGTVREDSGHFQFTGNTVGLPSDTPPSVAITTPDDDAQVWGEVEVAAESSDADGVEQISFLVDGSAIGAPDTEAPYAIDWDSTEVADGPHQLTAVARDAHGVTAEAHVDIEVTNSTDVRPPALALSGALAERAGGWVGAGTYRLDIEASDPAPGSGMDRVEVRLDDELVDEIDCPEQTCPAQAGFDLDADALDAGELELEVTAIDHAGLRTDRSLTFKVDGAVPDLEVSGSLVLAADGAIGDGTYELELEPPLILEPKPGKIGGRPVVPRQPRSDELPVGY